VISSAQPVIARPFKKNESWIPRISALSAKIASYPWTVKVTGRRKSTISHPPIRAERLKRIIVAPTSSTTPETSTQKVRKGIASCINDV